MNKLHKKFNQNISTCVLQAKNWFMLRKEMLRFTVRFNIILRLKSIHGCTHRNYSRKVAETIIIMIIRIINVRNFFFRILFQFLIVFYFSHFLRSSKYSVHSVVSQPINFKKISNIFLFSGYLGLFMHNFKEWSSWKIRH